MTHTKTPWSIEFDSDPSRPDMIWIKVQDGNYIAALSTAYRENYHTEPANAAFIVKCVNMHDELLELVKESIEEYCTVLDVATDEACILNVEDKLRRAKQALAKAQGGDV